MGFGNDLDRINRSGMARDIRAIRREITEPGSHQREIEARRAKAAKWDARKADADARRAEAMATPLSPTMHRAMVVLAVLCALTVVGLPITGLIAWMLHTKGKAHTAVTDTQREAAAAEAERYLTDDDREWLRRQDV